MQRSQRVTLADIAARSGVSTATASMILSERPDVSFSRETSLNIKFLCKWNFSCSHLWIFLIISHFHIFNLTFRIIINNKLNRIKNSHHSLNLKL